MKTRVKNATHYPSKQTQRFADGGKVASRPFANINSWKNDLGGMTAKSIFRTRLNDQPNLTPLSAPAYFMNSSFSYKKKKTDG